MGLSSELLLLNVQSNLLGTREPGVYGNVTLKDMKHVLAARRDSQNYVRTLPIEPQGHSSMPFMMHGVWAPDYQARRITHTSIALTRCNFVGSAAYRGSASLKTFTPARSFVIIPILRRVCGQYFAVLAGAATFWESTRCLVIRIVR